MKKKGTKKRGRLVAKPAAPGEPAKNVFGCMAGTVKIVGDIEAPVLPARAWNALTRRRRA